MKRSSYRGDDKAGTVVKYAGAEGYGGYGAPNKIHYEPIYFNGKKFVHSDKYRTYVNWQTVGGGKVVGTTLEQERAAVAASQERMARADLDPFQQTAKLAEEGKLFQFPDGTYPTGNEKSTSELLHEAVAKLEEEEAEEEEGEEEELDDRFDPDRPLIKPGEAGFDKKYQEYYDANVGRDEAIQNAYGSNRVWTSPDAVITEVTKDGVTTTNVAPRVMFDDRQKMSLFLNGFAWNDLDYCFKKNGALTDQNYADFVDDHIIDGAKNQRDGRNPDNIDQFVYRYVRRTKALEHLPPQFHHGIPLRTNVQHSRDKKERSATDWPVSWITYEEDGYTYCEIPYRTPTDLKEAFDREKFKYDGVAKRWYYPGMLDEAMELRLAALNVRRLGEPVTVEGEQPVTAEETAPEEPVVSDISEEPTVLEESDTPSAVEEYEEAVSQVKNGASSFDEWSERLENSGLSDNDKAKAYQYAATMLGFSNNVQEDEQQVLQYLNHYLNDLIGKSDEDTASEPEPQTEPEPETNETEAKETTFDNGLNDVFAYGGYGATAENYHELMEKTADVDTLQAYANERWGEPFSKKEIDVINQAKAVIDDPNILPELRGRILKNAHQFVFGWDTLGHRLKSDLLRNCLKATDNSLAYDDARQAVDHAHWGWYLTPKATHFSKTRADALKWVYAYRTLPFFSDQQNDEIVAREKNLLNLARDPAVSHVEALYIVDQLGSINDSVRKALDNYKENPGYYDQSGFAEKKWDQTTNDLNELEAKVSLLRDKVASQSAETVETPVEPAIEEPTVKTQLASNKTTAAANAFTAPVSLSPQTDVFKAKKSVGGGRYDMNYCVQGGQLFVSVADLYNAVASDETNNGYGLANMTENIMLCLEEGDFEQRKLFGKDYCNWKPFRDYVQRNNPDLANWGDKLEKSLGIDTAGRTDESSAAPDINRLSDDAASVLGFIKNKADQQGSIQGDRSFYDELRRNLTLTSRVDDTIYSLAKAGLLNPNAYTYGSRIELTPKGNSLFNNKLTPEQYDALLKLKDFTENHSDSEYRPDISGLFYDSGLDDKDIEKQVQSLKRRGFCSYAGTGDDSVCSISPQGLTALQENEVAKRREKKSLERAVKQLAITRQENALANDLAEKAFATRNTFGVESGLNANGYIQDVVRMETDPSSDISLGIGRSGPDFSEASVTNDVQATFDSLKNKGLIYTDDKGAVYTTEKLRNLLPAIRRYRDSIR